MPDDLLHRLVEGNRRFAAHIPALDISPSRRAELAQGQKPFAMVLGCVDSRVPPELIFDQGLGDLLVVRSAAQVVDQAVLGSLEFGALVLNIGLLVVLGHEQCGAVRAAVDARDAQARAAGSIAYLVDALAPAVGAGCRRPGDPGENSAREQVILQAQALRRQPNLAGVRVVAAYYHLASGEVEWMEE